MGQISSTIFASLLLIVSCYCACPDIPRNVHGWAHDTERALGVWYEYKYRTGPFRNDSSGINTTNNGSLIGLYSQDAHWKDISWYINHYAYEDPTFPSCSPLKCVAVFQEGNISSSNGARTVRAIFSESDKIETMTYTTLFTDYNVVQLLYRCHVPNSDDLQCKEPHFWINTRVKPPLLTAVQKSYIDKMANYYLAEVCRSTADMSSTPWDLSIDRPACSANAGTTEIPKIFAAAAAAQGVSLVKETVRNLPLGDF